MNNKILLGIVVVAIVLIGGFVLLRNNATEKQSVVTEEQNTAQAGRDDTRPRETTTVTLSASGFTPDTITIKPDTAIAFVNRSGAISAIDSDPHPVHTSYEPLNLGSFANGETLKLVFPETGTYHYHDHLNPSRQGTVIVKE